MGLYHLRSPSCHVVPKQSWHENVKVLNPTKPITKHICGKLEVTHQVTIYYSDVYPFLEENENLGLAIRKKMLDMLQDPQKMHFLLLELAIAVVAGLPFVQATYNLEKDWPLALTCSEKSNMLVHAIQFAHFPNLN